MFRLLTISLLLLTFSACAPHPGVRFVPDAPLPPPPAASAGGYQVGVGFGGWLLMEQWMFPSIPLAHAPGPESELNYIREVSRWLGPDAAVRSMHRHWEQFYTDEDLQALADFGITHVKIPVGWWLFDPPVTGGSPHDPGFTKDGFVSGGLAHLEGMIRRLGRLGIRVAVVAHALPGGAQNAKVYQGDVFETAGFWCDIDPRTGRPFRDEGDAFLGQLAAWALQLEDDPATAGVIYALQITNEPLLGSEHEVCPPDGVEQAGTDKVEVKAEWVTATLARLRKSLPAERYDLLVNWFTVPEPAVQRDVLDSQPGAWADWHLYQAFNSCSWGGSPEACYVDEACSDRTRCNTCCGSAPMPQGAGQVVGEWSLATCHMLGSAEGVRNDPQWLRTWYADQVSAFRARGYRGDFFWTAKIGVNYDPTAYPPGWLETAPKPVWWGTPPPGQLSPLEQLPGDYLIGWDLLRLIRAGIAIPPRDLQIEGACRYTIPGQAPEAYDCSQGCAAKPCGC